MAPEANTGMELPTCPRMYNGQHHLQPSMCTRLSFPTQRGTCTEALHVVLQSWVTIAIFLGTMIALYWGLVCSYGRREGQPKETSLHYLNSLRWMCCLLLCSCVNVAKSLLAKVMSAHFYVESYFDKMQAALRQVQSP